MHLFFKRSSFSLFENVVGKTSLLFNAFNKPCCTRKGHIFICHKLKSFFSTYFSTLTHQKTFVRFTRFRVGDGTHVKFWHDSWCGGQLLRVRFLELFRIALDTETSVADHLIILGETRH